MMLRRRARLIVRWFALERTRRVLMYLPKSVTAPRSRSLSKAARKGPRSKISVDRWSNLLGWLKQAWFTDLANLKELGTQACLDFVHADFERERERSSSEDGSGRTSAPSRERSSSKMETEGPETSKYKSHTRRAPEEQSGALWETGRFKESSF